MKAKQSVEEQFKDRLVRLLKENVRYLVDDRDDPRVGILARDQMEGFLMLWLRDAIAQAKQEERDNLKAQVRKEIEEQITKMENSNWLHGMGLSGSQAEYIEANIKASYRSIPSLKKS